MTINTSLRLISFLCLTVVIITSCSEQKVETDINPVNNLKLPESYFNYANQNIPAYIRKDNTGSNSITNEAATLGRVLFYDKSLSENKTISCSSCHQQAHGFSDIATQSTGKDGKLTARHSMRLINSRFSNEIKFFWDERAATLENQTTQPVRDHVEMGLVEKTVTLILESLFRDLKIPDITLLYLMMLSDQN
jgi:cytochrome c peroxidase